MQFGSRALVSEWFVPFQEVLELHCEEYRTANPDDWSTIGAMPRKFNQWLHDSRHAQAIADKLPKVRVRARYGAADAEMSDKAVAVKGS